MKPAEIEPIPLLDLLAQHQTIREEILPAVTRVVDSQRFILSEEVQEFEKETAEYCGSRHAIGCASGSDALLLALKALDIGPGDEVLTTPYTFFATAGSIVHAGARPVFADIDAVSFNLDAASMLRMLDRHPNVKAIMPVHLFGACARMEPVLEAARERGIAVIEDAAQAIGSETNGRRAGSMGDIGCFSFFPSKNLGGYGDGGLLTTQRADLAEKLRALRVHGSRKKYYYEWVGLNSRLDSLQAAILRVKLKRLDEWTSGRQRNADLYRRYFEELGAPVKPPGLMPCATRHIYNQFVIRCQRRDELKDWLQRERIGCEVYYPLPLHLQTCFADLGYREGDFPVSEACAKDSLALPVYAELKEEQILRIAKSIARFYGV